MNSQSSWITTAISEDIVRGALELERTERGVLTHRLPARARTQFADGQMAMAQSQPSGVRLVFRTSATAIELDTLPTKMIYIGAPPRPQGVYDLIVDGEPTVHAIAEGGNTVTIDMATGTAQRQSGPVSTIRFADLPGAIQDRRDLVAAQRNHRTCRIANRRPARTRSRHEA